MAIKIVTKIDDLHIKIVLQYLYKTVQKNSALSPRSLHEINSLYLSNQILFALDDTRVVGWLWLIPYGNEIQELAAGYVRNSYRSQGIFTQLLTFAQKNNKTSVTVTFNPKVARKLKRLNFRVSSLAECILITRGLFLYNRLNLPRLKAISRHHSKNRPYYMLHSNKYE